jgi:UDP-N-acetylglucosamine:LPS N-acetylglucosamine transferase
MPLPMSAVQEEAAGAAAARGLEATPAGARLKLALVCSPGGHLAQLYRLHPWWRQHERLWVTFRKPDSESLIGDEQVVWAYHPTTRNLPNLLRNLWLSWRVLRDHRPDVVVSNGAGVAFPFFLSARLLGIKTVYVEVYDRIDSRTMSGRLCYPLSDLFLLQWDEQRRLYPKGHVIGTLL